MSTIPQFEVQFKLALIKSAVLSFWSLKCATKLSFGVIQFCEKVACEKLSSSKSLALV